MRKLDYENAILDIVPLPIRNKGIPESFTEEGWNGWIWTDPRPKPTWDEIINKATNLLKKIVTNEIDTVTEQIIIYGFVYNSQRVRLNDRDQFFINGADRMREDITYPKEFKVWSGENGEPIKISFDNSTDLHNFYLSCFNFIDTTLSNGFILKDSINTMDKDEVISFTDNRSLPE